jgi:hypothetical protein
VIIINKNRTISGCFSSFRSDICNSLTYTASTEVAHAIFPEMNLCSTESVDYPTEKRTWMQRAGA